MPGSRTPCSTHRERLVLQHHRAFHGGGGVALSLDARGRVDVRGSTGRLRRGEHASSCTLPAAAPEKVVSLPWNSSRQSERRVVAHRFGLPQHAQQMRTYTPMSTRAPYIRYTKCPSKTKQSNALQEAVVVAACKQNAAATCHCSLQHPPPPCSPLTSACSAEGPSPQAVPTRDVHSVHQQGATHASKPRNTILPAIVQRLWVRRCRVCWW